MGHPVFRNLPIGHLIFREDQDGSIFVEKTVYGGRLLSAAANIALVLNNECCERGLGRVYALVIAPLAPPKLATAAMFNAYNAIRALPEIFYVSEPWSIEQQAEWRQLTPFEQLHRVYARYGWVKDPVVGVACGVDLRWRQYRQAQFNGVTEAPVTILVSPIPYVGPTVDFTRHCNRVYRLKKDGDATRCSWEGKVRDWAAFRNLKVSGVGGILDKLEELRRQNDECLMVYGTVKRWFETAYRQAAEIQEGGGEGVETETEETDVVDLELSVADREDNVDEGTFAVATTEKTSPVIVISSDEE